MNAIIQNVILVAILLAAAGVTLKKVAPNLWNKALGRNAASASAGGCSGCSTCGGCDKASSR
ncbi:hypothetical protein ACDA63_14750 [Uliginosibacterium sp. sgz301328]|uniref:hypothetical protein n=1 Tax=Uliginosibacterium sp. sgz301328 TaxID=3243764 RepID=UPI00359ECD0B